MPITFVERARGQSKLRLRIIAESAVLPWKLAFSRAAGHARERSIAVPGR
jgi:hypothetical protein